MDYYFILKTIEVTKLAGKWMDLEYIIVSKITTFQGEKTLHILTHMLIIVYDIYHVYV